MDPLYIVELEFSVSESADLPAEAVYERLVEHAERWLSRDVADPVDLSASGSAELSARRGAEEFTRSLRWTATRTGSVRLVQCSMRQPIENGHGATFVCDFTIFQRGNEAQLRIELGRESADGLMSPVSVAFLRRPGLLSSALRDPDLRCCYQQQRVDGRYNWINPPQAAIVPEAIQHEKRLPLLLVDGSSEHAQEFGRSAAAQMSGLAQVLLVDRRSQVSIVDYLRSINATIPDDGARLIWPSLSARHPEFWDLGRTETVIGHLMKIVAGVSVAARGHNRFRIIAAEEARRERETIFEAALAEAKAAGDDAAEAETLRGRVSELSDEVGQWVEEVERLSAEMDGMNALKAHLDYWKGEATRLQTAASGKATVTWESAPQLDADDLGQLARFLTETSDGAIAFTANALRTWRQTGYPHVEAMREALLVLAQAAVEWRRAECHVGMNIKEWFKTRWEVAMAPTDEGLAIKKLEKFEFESETYKRETHLKLDDGVPAWEVGRVYFAMDSTRQRVIVDHVGLKLYGV